jgi:phosphatidylserine decarboxylase
VVLDGNTTYPLWLARVGEQDVVLSWVAGYVSANAASLGSLDAYLRAPSVTPVGLADFRAFAARQGVVVPADAESDASLQPVLSEAVARAKWADGGAYSVEALVDPEVRAAVKSFDELPRCSGQGPRARFGIRARSKPFGEHLGDDDAISYRFDVRAGRDERPRERRSSAASPRAGSV